MTEKLNGFFNEDDSPVNPDLMPKPSLCATCKHDSDSEQEILCSLNRIGQQSAVDFKCDTYEER